MQEIRTKETREFLKDLCRQVKDKLSKYNLSEDMKKQSEEINTDEYIRKFHLRMFKDVKEFTDMILSMKWILIKNRTKMLFWTSDHPINRYNPIVNLPFENLGLFSQGIQIFFPLTPRLSLCLCDLVEYFTFLKRWELTI